MRLDLAGMIMGCLRKFMGPSAAVWFFVLPLSSYAEGHRISGGDIPKVGLDGGGPGVDLDQLLTLPSTRVYSVERRGGSSREEWRKRFRNMQEALVKERAILEENEQELVKIAGAKGAWNLGGPGMGGMNMEANPVDYELRQSVRRGRSEIARIKREIRELEVEANLAEVPKDWR